MNTRLQLISTTLQLAITTLELRLLTEHDISDAYEQFTHDIIICNVKLKSFIKLKEELDDH